MADGRKLGQWEFWPFWAFYAPVYLQLLGSAVRNRSFPHFCCANPGIPYGGLLEYSKHGVMEPLPASVVPRTVVVRAPVEPEDAIARIEAAGLHYPLIAKPDRGERGFFVEKIDAEVELRSYLARFRTFCTRLVARGFADGGERLLLQEYIAEPEEFGLMWVRSPDWPRGRITSIVHKRLLSVTGDGSSSLAELIRSDERASLHESMLRATFASRLGERPEAGEQVNLVEIGNHIRGATFLDASSEADEELVAAIEPLAQAIPGFYLGRFDVRAASIEAVRRGRFHVIEVNGVNSEPAHIYDPSNELRHAYRDLLAHWRMVEEVAGANRRAGCRPPTFRELRRAVGRHASRLAAAREAEAEAKTRAVRS